MNVCTNCAKHTVNVVKPIVVFTGSAWRVLIVCKTALGNYKPRIEITHTAHCTLPMAPCAYDRMCLLLHLRTLAPSMRTAIGLTK